MIRGSEAITSPTSATAQRIVDAASTIIATHGEAHLRINDVCQSAGVTATTLYTFFDDREHLVCAGLHHLFATTSYAAINEFRALVMESTSAAGFRRMLHGVTTNLLSPERRQIRRIRLHALSDLRHRPALRSAVAGLLRDEIDQFASWIERADADGLITVADPPAVAAWALSHTIAHTALDGDGATSIDHHWDEVWRWALGTVVFADNRTFPARPFEHVDRLLPQTKRHPTAMRIIDWAAERIDQVGESAFRAEHLPSEIAKSTTPIYRYFGTRENLVGAAQEERFARSILDLIAEADTADVSHLIASAFANDRSAHRIRRLESAAATLGRPDVAQAIAERRDANLAELARSISAHHGGVDLYDGVRLGASLLSSLAIVELLDLGIDADTHRAISLPLLERALRDSLV